MKEIQETHQKKGVVSSDEYYTPPHIIEALGTSTSTLPRRPIRDGKPPT